MALQAQPVEPVEVPGSPVAAPIEITPHTTKRAIAMVVLCTLFGAAAQILIKTGAPALDASQLGTDPIAFIISLILNPPIILGHVFLGVNLVLLTLALREGQLSILYPIIGLTYVWVTILSPLYFDDQMNVSKGLGVALIVIGVSCIGIGSRK